MSTIDTTKPFADARDALAIYRRYGAPLCGYATNAIDALDDLLAALDAQEKVPPAQPVPAQEPLFLLHTGAVCGNEREDWEVEANNGDAVEAYCDENPGKVVGLYLAPQAPPAAVPADEYDESMRPFRLAQAIHRAVNDHGHIEAHDAQVAADAAIAFLGARPVAIIHDYTEADRKRIVSAMQSMRDRLGTFLIQNYGDGFDGDIDLMLEAINFIKTVRIGASPAPPKGSKP